MVLVGARSSCSPLARRDGAAQLRPMVEIVNLGWARKQLAKRAAEQEAAANRARFGETKAARKLREAREAERRRLLEGARVEKDGE